MGNGHIDKDIPREWPSGSCRDEASMIDRETKSMSRTDTAPERQEWTRTAQRVRASDTIMTE